MTEDEVARLKEQNRIMREEIEGLYEELSEVSDLSEMLQAKISDLKQEIEKIKPTEIVLPYPIEESKDEDFEPLKDHPKYEISRKYNYPIRVKDTKYVIKERIRSGYVAVSIDGKPLFKHILVAKQWVHKDSEDQNQVDHLDHNHFNYRVDNLMWKTPSENSYNRKSHNGKEFEFFTYDDPIFVEFPLVPFLEYNGHEFSNYYYSNGNFYYDTKNGYKKINVLKQEKAGKKGQIWVYDIVSLIDKDGQRVWINLDKYKRLLEGQKDDDIDDSTFEESSPEENA